MRGSQPTGSGNLIVELDDYATVAADAIAAKYLRPFIGAKQLIHTAPRWCLWMADSDFGPRDPQRSPVLKERVEAARVMRLASKKLPTQRSAQTPYLFQENCQPLGPYVGIPAHFSETRRFATVAHFEPATFCGNANFTAEDPYGFLFGIISSSAFIASQRAVGGALESRLRFSNTVVWNSLPLPDVDDKLRQQVIEAGKGVIAARELHPERSL